MKKVYKLEFGELYFNINLEHISIILPLKKGDSLMGDSLGRSSEFVIPLNILGNITYIRIPLTNEEIENSTIYQLPGYKERCDKIWENLNRVYNEYHKPSKGFNLGPL